MSSVRASQHNAFNKLVKYKIKMIYEMSQPGSEMEEVYDQCCWKDSGTSGPHWGYQAVS